MLGLNLLQGWSAATLTPNRNEFLRLAEAVDVKVDEKDPTAALPEVCRHGTPAYLISAIRCTAKADGEDPTAVLAARGVHTWQALHCIALLFLLTCTLGHLL